MFDGASPNLCTRLKTCSSPFDFTQYFYEKFYGPLPPLSFNLGLPCSHLIITIIVCFQVMLLFEPDES